jgi:hypothetical protein
VRIIAAICSALLVMEFVLHGIAMLTMMEAGIDPLTRHFGFRPGPPILLTLGVLDIAAAAGIVAGFWKPVLAEIAAGYAILFFGMMLVLRFYRRLGGILPPDFPLFFTAAVLLLIVRLAR